MNRKIYLLLLLYALLATSLHAQRSTPTSRIEKIIGDSLTAIAREYMFSDSIKRVRLTINSKDKTITVTAADEFGHIPFRHENVERIYKMLHQQLSSRYPGYTILASAFNRDIRNLIPNYLREKPDSLRFFRAVPLSVPAVIAIDKQFRITAGLHNRNIAVWNSHGIHNLLNDTLWGWQRPVMFQTVEDLLTTSFVIPFLAPMLENAGATVYLPRERDINRNEVIVDNDILSSSRYKEYNDRHTWKNASPGFAHLKSWYTYPENPFQSGTYLRIPSLTDDDESSRIEWTPDIPEDGSYAVYVSYKTEENSTSDALYTVHHKGGTSRFSVNQTVNGGTWLYLGHFNFSKGRKTYGKVVLSNISRENGRIVTADAIKFGGGMGTVTGVNPLLIRDNQLIPTISGYPRFAEGSRYWLQWAGIPDSVYSRTLNQNHYSDDFQSRGFWVNYLREKLGVPVDMALAFHTDAGIAKSDSTIGTLVICTVNNSAGDSIYSNGISRWAARDMIDLIQTEIVNSIRATYRSDWTRRGIWNRSYSESRVPEVPTMLLELLSHQNFEDMKYALDPGFRFTVSRAIYKGMLKYLAIVNQQHYVVQPLPVHRFSSKFTARNKVKLKWKATIDTTEATAMPTHYILYTRTEMGGFDNGIPVMADSIELTIQPGEVYSYQITAVNPGGQSFPSEILTVYREPHDKGEVMIINGFTRISGPEHFSLGPLAGFLNDKDAGVPYLYDLNFTGRQYDLSVNSVYRSNSNPGFGASERTYDKYIIQGNNFDYPALHGRSMTEAGYSFVSAGADAIAAGDVTLSNYQVVDFIAGKQKQTSLGNVKKTPEFETFPLALQRVIREYTENGGNLIVSGAYIASDMYHNDSISRSFIEEVLHVRPGGDGDQKFGMIRLDSQALTGLKLTGQLNYYTEPNEQSYFAEETDVLEPSGSNAWAIGWYNGGDNPSIVVAQSEGKTIVMGFPFETITEAMQRDKLMQLILQYMFKK